MVKHYGLARLRGSSIACGTGCSHVLLPSSRELPPLCWQIVDEHASSAVVTHKQRCLCAVCASGGN
jgi:hypothetical protein